MGGLGGGGIPIPVGGGIGGIVITIIIIVVLNLLGGGSGGGLGGLGGGTGGGGPATSLDPNDTSGQFVNAVTVDVQTFWQDYFQSAGKTYPVTETVLFTDQTNTGCGTASSATGPFYCPADKNVYLDTAFFDELSNRFGAPGDFARAYVIAHEFGHHVQDALGIMDQVAQQQQSNPSSANDQSIRLELQADCLAGVWAYSVYKNPDSANVESITDKDVKDALDAAAAVGDNRIQEQTGDRHDRQGVMDAWLRRAALHLVQQRLQERLDRRLRHLRGRHPVERVRSAERRARRYFFLGGNDRVNAIALASQASTFASSAMTSAGMTT
jgi:predicted metalloprotease